MFWLIWDVTWAVIAAVLFGATLASPMTGTRRIVILICFGLGILFGILGIFICGGIAFAVP